MHWGQNEASNLEEFEKLTGSCTVVCEAKCGATGVVSADKMLAHRDCGVPQEGDGRVWGIG
jgi:hypothetical protein